MLRDLCDFRLFMETSQRLRALIDASFAFLPANYCKGGVENWPVIHGLDL